MTPSDPATQVPQGVCARLFAWLTNHKLLITKLLFLIATTVFVFHYADRPKVVRSYQTNNPEDRFRGGVRYTCGCALPTSLQGVEDTNPPAGSNSTLSGCYNKGALETARVLMYSNFTGVDKLEGVLEDTNSSKSFSGRLVEGLHQDMQAHDVFWDHDDYFDKVSTIRSSLYLGGFRQNRISEDIRYLNDSGRSTVFPAAYVMVAFSFMCNDCERCSLDLVNKIFTEVAGNAFGKSWGDCIYWNQENQCASSNPFYEAKCVMYPMAGIPLNFAIQRFLKKFQNTPGIDSESIVPPWYWSYNRPHSVSFDANVLYMNLSSVTEGSVQLSFVELQKGSATWLQLRQMYPAFDTECSDLPQVEVCNGTSLCNLYKNDESDGHLLNCVDARNKSQCVELRNDSVSIDDASNLWGEFGIVNGNWSELMCMDYSCRKKPPYLILRQRAPAMQHSTLNNFLDAKILLDFWAKNSGVCTKTYPDVVRVNESNRIMFLETECHSPSNSDNNVDSYCWLTGRYRNLTDIPGDGWHRRDTSLDPERSFVCYYVTDQARLNWVVVTFGVLFGWLGTVELLFIWFKSLLTKLDMYIKARGSSRGYHRLRRTSTGEESVNSSLVSSNSEGLVVNSAEKGRRLSWSLSSRLQQEPDTVANGEVALACPPTYRRLREERSTPELLR